MGVSSLGSFEASREHLAMRRRAPNLGRSLTEAGEESCGVPGRCESGDRWPREDDEEEEESREFVAIGVTVGDISEAQREELRVGGGDFKVGGEGFNGGRD
ncbi:hypothetical protein CRG98_041780 [Punica granatum]|uniref:Uncharacterized protein n=1 Tax=Punica granatum TaxID=22663 RepID=A0A2I0I282_PUNGR|nr:hypothetical protein CRG98_041780 [Punica granatum]